MKKTGSLQPCEQCHEMFYVPKWKTQNTKYPKARFCSVKCKTQASKVRMVGMGARSTSNQGYVTIYYPSHPDAHNNGTILEHRLIAEQKYGRRLQKNEHVHHINGIRDDNRPENLEIVTASKHAGITSKNGAAKRLTMRQELIELRDRVIRYEQLYGALEV